MNTNEENSSRAEAKILDFPGFVDVHVHFRDPGMAEAETLASGRESARRGGFAAVVTMPNTTPACDTPELVRYQSGAWMGMEPESGRENGHSEASAEISPEKKTRVPAIIPSACITKGRAGREVADLEALCAAGAAFFTDDGGYVYNDKVMEEAMRRAAALGMVVCEHAMDPHVLNGGIIRDCALARRLGLPIIPVETETVAIRRDIALCRETGCRLHIQHISTAPGVEMVREAQREGLPVTAEATPHHLLLTCDDFAADDANFKMAPPLGNREDRAELRRAVKDGVLMFATDHAPHPARTKAGGFARSVNGIIGLEVAIPITYHAMVEEEGMNVQDWAKAWWEMPRAIIKDFDLRAKAAASARTVVEIGRERTVDVAAFASLSRNCPYNGMRFSCWPFQTLLGN